MAIPKSLSKCHSGQDPMVAMDEGNGSEASVRGCTGTAGLQSVLDRFKEDAQHRPDERRIIVEETAQALGQGPDPLAAGIFSCRDFPLSLPLKTAAAFIHCGPEEIDRAGSP